MFGFGPMSSFYDEDFERHDPTEPFSRAEFSVHDDRELADIDAGRGDYDRATCPDCGAALKYRYDAVKARCRNCGGKFLVN